MMAPVITRILPTTVKEEGRAASLQKTFLCRKYAVPNYGVCRPQLIRPLPRILLPAPSLPSGMGPDRITLPWHQMLDGSEGRRRQKSTTGAKDDGPLKIFINLVQVLYAESVDCHPVIVKETQRDPHNIKAGQNGWNMTPPKLFKRFKARKNLMRCGGASAVGSHL